MAKLLIFKSQDEFDEIFLDRIKKKIEQDPEMLAEIIFILWNYTRTLERGDYDNAEPLEARLGEAYHWASEWNHEIGD